MKTRTIAALLAGALIAGCSGGNRLLPGIPPGANAPQIGAMQPDRSDVRALVRVRIPQRSGRRPSMHPATISPLTQSVSIAVNTAAAQVFNTTHTSPGCTIGSKGTTCTFAVHATAGTDTFTVTTYGAVNATGSALDRGVARVAIAKGKANQVAVTLGPVVTTTANSGTGSLRYAVGSANAGDTIMFLLAKGSTITLASPILILGNVKIAGPGAADLSISGGGTHQLFQIIGTASLSGLTLAHGKAATTNQPGGAIWNSGALTLIGDVFGSNTSIVSLRRAPHKAHLLKLHGLRPHCTTTYREGGAVYNDGELTMSSTSFTNNVVQSDIAACIQAEGGAVFNDVSGTLNSTGDTYSSNSAYAGGAVYNGSADAATFTGDAFTANAGCTAASGCVTSGCGATSCTSFAVGEGGAIYDDGVGITVTNSTFTNNVVGGKTAASLGEGGAIFLNSQLPTITGSTFSGNLAGGGNSSCSVGAGGAIVAANPVELDGDIFKNNSAVGDNSSEGGAITAVSTIEGTGDTFSGNEVVASGGACTTSGSAIGGAVFSSASSATFTKSAFTSNSVTANAVAGGGALGGAGTAVLNGCTFTSNTALANGEFGATGVTAAGGAFYAQTIAKISGSTFTSNTATIEGPNPAAVEGGAVVVTSGTVLSSKDAYKSNVATEKAGTQTAGGGAIAAPAGSIVSNGDTFTSNSASTPGTAIGGAVYAGTGAQISNATIVSNTASGPVAAGGGVAIASTGSSQLAHDNITGNFANGTGTLGVGGGVYDTSGAYISDSTVSQNKATISGGAIYSASNPEEIVSSSVSGNAITRGSAASGGGAGVYAASGAVMEDDTISNNTATVSGPGPAGGGGILSGSGLFMIATTISGNKVLGTATAGDGGGGILTGSGVTAVNSTISNNSSSMDGGGVAIVGSATLTLANVTLFGNTATGKGGNIDNRYTITLTNSVVGGGHASSGVDVYNASSATLTSNGYDIFGSAFVGGGTYTAGTGDVFANPNLLALANNGGPTFTNADQLSSPGRAHIPYSGGNCGSISELTDQRGFTRGAGGKCDSGAYEYAGVATAIRHRPFPKMTFQHKGEGLHLHLPLLRALKSPSL